MSDSWTPKTKYQLVDWLSGRWPEHRKKFQAKNKKQLYAIFYSVVRGQRVKIVPVGDAYEE